MVAARPLFRTAGLLTFCGKAFLLNVMTVGARTKRWTVFESGVNQSLLLIDLSYSMKL